MNNKDNRKPSRLAGLFSRKKAATDETDGANTTGKSSGQVNVLLVASEEDATELTRTQEELGGATIYQAPSPRTARSLVSSHVYPECDLYLVLDTFFLTDKEDFLSALVSHAHTGATGVIVTDAALVREIKSYLTSWGGKHPVFMPRDRLGEGAQVALSR